MWGVQGLIEGVLHDLINASVTQFFTLSGQCAENVRTRFERTAKDAASKRMRAGNKTSSSSINLSNNKSYVNLVCGLEKLSNMLRADDSVLLHVLCVPGATDMAWLERLLRSGLWSVNAVDERTAQTALHVAVSRLPTGSVSSLCEFVSVGVYV